MRTGARSIVVLAALLLGSRAAGAQDPTGRVMIVDRGPGFMARLLDAALASPHVLVPPGDSAARLARGESYPRTVIVLGRDATVASRVRGDVIVVDGDLYLRPGAQIEGRAVAIGGTVASSSLASVRDGRLMFQDETYQVMPSVAGWELRYRNLRVESPKSRLPLLAGFPLPTYDRINGLSLSVAPTFSFAGASVQLQPAVTYRSHLGAVDPAALARFRLGRLTRAEVSGARGTFTNDGWIYSDMVNSLTSLFLGRDVRNYYRAGRAEGRLLHRFESGTWQQEPWIGARYERAESATRDTGSTSGPWSLFDRKSEDGMRRPNPPVDEIHAVSALVGTSVRWEPADVRTVGSIESEVLFAEGGATLVQSTASARVEFPAFRTHSFRLEAHGVLTLGDEAPRQRWVYLGGSGTLRTLDLFEQAGDQLLFVESRYTVPFPQLEVRWLGVPSVALRHMLGAAGVGGLPPLEQEIGLRLGVGYLRADVLHNPRREETKVSAGFSFTR